MHTISSFRIAQLSMVQRLLAYVNDPSRISITQSVPALQSAIAALALNGTTANDLLLAFRNIITGITTERKQARLNLANFSYTIMKAVYSFANSGTPNPELAAKVKFNLSNLQNMKFEKLSSVITNAIAATQEVIGSLASYKITPATITEWQAMLDAYNTVLNSPVQAIKQRKTTGEQCATSIQDAMDLVRNQVDGLVASLMQTQNAYYLGYRSQRELSGTAAKRNTRADVMVTDELNHPFINAKVTVDAYTDPATGKSYKAVSGYTDANGFVSVKSFFAGERTISISGEGVKPKTFGPFNFERGKAVATQCICAPAFDAIPAASPESTPAPVAANS